MVADNRGFAGFIRFAVKFLLIFGVLYYGTFYFIGIATPGGVYSFFADRYLDYPEALMRSLLQGCRLLLKIFGTDSYRADYDRIYITGGRGVQVAYDCYGYGVMSFWVAFVMAGPSVISRRLKWLFGGLFLLWLINVVRIALFLLSVNGGWPMPFGLDHHTWFNIGSYLAIFLLIYFHEKFNKIKESDFEQGNTREVKAG